jgi:hypothetical protein
LYTFGPSGSSALQIRSRCAEIYFACSNPKEIHRHDLSYLVAEPPSVAQGGKGVVVSGCPACKKRINTVTQFLDHLANDVMPELSVSG